MAALQSRASAHHRHAHAQEHEDEVQTSSAGVTAGSAAAPAHPAAHATSGSGQTSIEDETWILFPPPRHARRPSSSSHEPQLIRPDAVAASPPDPFAAGPPSDTTPSSSWHHVAHHHHHHASHASADGVVAVAIAGRSPTTSGGGGEERSDKWSTLPRPLDNASSFFEDEEDDAHHSSSRPGSGTRSRQLRQARHAAHVSRSSPRPSMQSSKPNINLVSSTHAAFDGNETDLLSLPSSLSVSDRSPSEGPASPFFIDHPDTFPEPDNLDQARVQHPHARSSSSNTLTAAALSRMSDIAPHNAFTTTTAKAAEAELTSGSEDDSDELLLARAPDAISAGIRPSRAPRRPLQSVRTPSQALSASSSGQKRRHRQAGSRDKSSKRSNTSGSVLSASAASGGLALRGARGKGKARELITHEEKIVLPQSPLVHARGSSRIARAARQIFAVDEEVVDMLNQPGSVFHQARPTSSGRPKDATSGQTHGFEAFSAQMQYELGESPHQQRIFGDNIDGNASDSGDETETERGSAPPAAASVAVPRRPYHRHPALLLADSVYWRRVLRSLTF